MAENQPQKSKKEVLVERIRAKYPDLDLTDEEVLSGRIGDDYDDYEKRLGEYADREGKLEDMLVNDPKNAQFLADMVAGKDPWIAVVERLGVDGITDLLNDPEKKAAYEEANRTYAERVAREKEIDAEYERNIEESRKMREQLDSQYGEETVDAALSVIDQMAKDYIMGKVTPEAFDIALKVVKRDADLENARSEGEIAGRNARIEEKLRNMEGGDGLPVMGGSSAAPKQKRNMNIFDYAEAAK